MKIESYHNLNISETNFSNLIYKKYSTKNILENIFSFIAIISTLISVLPLFLVVIYVMYKGGSQLNLTLITKLPEPPGSGIYAGGIGNAILGTFIISGIAALISIPIGVGGGIYLAEYSIGGSFSSFIRFGTNVLSGVPSIIAGVFIYGTIVSTKILLGSNFSAIAGGISLSILMIPTIIKTTDEGLKLVSEELRKASYGIGASKFITVSRVTLPTAIRPIATGIVLAIARASGETAPLIFTALFSFYWPNEPTSLLEPIASLSVLIYNFALEPYEAQNQLAWGASFFLISLILITNLFARWLSNKTMDK